MLSEKIIRSIDFLNFPQLSPSFDFRGELLNPYRKWWSFTLTQYEKWNEAPELYEVGVKSPAVGISAEDECGASNNRDGKDGDE